MMFAVVGDKGSLFGPGAGSGVGSGSGRGVGLAWAKGVGFRYWWRRRLVLQGKSVFSMRLLWAVWMLLNWAVYASWRVWTCCPSRTAWVVDRDANGCSEVVITCSMRAA